MCVTLFLLSSFTVALFAVALFVNGQISRSAAAPYVYYGRSRRMGTAAVGTGVMAFEGFVFLSLEGDMSFRVSWGGVDAYGCCLFAEGVGVVPFLDDCGRCSVFQRVKGPFFLYFYF